MKNNSFEEESNRILKGVEKAYETMVKINYLGASPLGINMEKTFTFDASIVELNPQVGFKKERGTPLVISENDKVKQISSENIPQQQHIRDHSSLVRCLT